MFSIDSQIQDDTAVLKLSGQFDFNAYTEFKPYQTKALESPDVRQITLDMSNLDYLDSAALGTLLLLREKAQDRNIEVVLRGAQGVVREIIDIAHFERLFRFID